MARPGLLVRLVHSALIVAALAASAAVSYAADQVETKTGERYVGRIISLNSETLLIQSDVAGTLKLPRSKVSVIQLDVQPASKPGSSASNQPPVSRSALSNAPATLQNSGASTPSLEQSPAALLEGASPEARAKFNQMMAGLLSGKLSAEDIREEARAVANQARALRGELGEEAGQALDGYLAILDRFLGESSATPSGSTNKPARPRAP